MKNRFRLIALLVIIASTSWVMVGCGGEENNSNDKNAISIHVPQKVFMPNEQIVITAASNFSISLNGYGLTWEVLSNTCGASIIDASGLTATVVATGPGYFTVAVCGLVGSLSSNTYPYVSNSNVLTVTIRGYGEKVMVTSKEQLFSHGSDAVYVLQNDIDMAGEDFAPVEEFKGVLDGNGFKIRNLKVGGIDHLLTQQIGFIGINRGTIKNIIFENVNITALGESQNVGLVAVNYGALQEVRVSGVISGSSQNICVGGLCGTNYGRIIGCRNSSSVSGVKNVGGIVGNNMSNIYDNTNVGTVTGTTNKGGIAGYNSAGEITDCISKVNIVGTQSSVNNKVTNCKVVS